MILGGVSCYSSLASTTCSTFSLFYTLSLLATFTPKHNIKTRIRYFNVAYIGLAPCPRLHLVLSLEVTAFDRIADWLQEFLLILPLPLSLLLGDT